MHAFPSHLGAHLASLAHQNAFGPQSGGVTQAPLVQMRPWPHRWVGPQLQFAHVWLVRKSMHFEFPLTHAEQAFAQQLCPEGHAFAAPHWPPAQTWEEELPSGHLVWPSRQARQAPFWQSWPTGQGDCDVQNASGWQILGVVPLAQPTAPGVQSGGLHCQLALVPVTIQFSVPELHCGWFLGWPA